MSWPHVGHCHVCQRDPCRRHLDCDSEHMTKALATLTAERDISEVQNSRLRAERDELRLKVEFLSAVSDQHIAELFHSNYEELAPLYGYKTRDASAVPWDDVPSENQNLMIATVFRVRKELRALRAAREDAKGES